MRASDEVELGVSGRNKLATSVGSGELTVNPGCVGSIYVATSGVSGEFDKRVASGMFGITKLAVRGGRVGLLTSGSRLKTDCSFSGRDRLSAENRLIVGTTFRHSKSLLKVRLGLLPSTICLGTGR